MKPQNLPLLELFLELREAGLPLGIDDYHVALHALEAGFGIGDREALARLCRTLWIKSHDNFPLFSHIFEHVMVRSAPVPAPSNRQAQKPKEEPPIPPEFDSTSASEPASETPAFPSEPAEELIRGKDEVQMIAALSRPDSWQEDTYYNPFILTDEYFSITRRRMKQNWRNLRRPLREGPPTELDVEATVDKIGHQGFLWEPVLVPRRKNRAQLLLFIDQDGSMVPFHELSRRLVGSAVRGGRVGSVSVYYFHNYPNHYLYLDPRRAEPEPIHKVLGQFHDERTGVLIISDAGAARGRYNIERILGTSEFLERLKRQFLYIAWLNPMPHERWLDTSAEMIKHFVPMLDISPQDIENAIRVLNGRYTRFNA